MIVVSDSSPLIALVRIGRLNLLASFYKRILIPAEVNHEVTVAGRGLPGARRGTERQLDRSGATGEVPGRSLSRARRREPRRR